MICNVGVIESTRSYDNKGTVDERNNKYIADFHYYTQSYPIICLTKKNLRPTISYNLLNYCICCICKIMKKGSYDILNYY